MEFFFTTRREGRNVVFSYSKDPGPEGPALIHPGGVMKVATFTNRVQVSGVGCQVSATEVDPLDRSRS